MSKRHNSQQPSLMQYLAKKPKVAEQSTNTTRYSPMTTSYLTSITTTAPTTTSTTTSGTTTAATSSTISKFIFFLQ